MTEAAEARGTSERGDAGGAVSIFCGVARFDAALGLVLAYLCASLWLGQRRVRRGFPELHPVVEASKAKWAAFGERARSPGAVAPLAPFVRAGVRNALLWFLGTSLASLLAPSRGVHERLRAVKREELAWLQGRVAGASSALRRGDEPGAAALPALLAWEGRVASAPEWPFDASTWLRFTLLLAVPLGSWLGGALAERFVERWLGA